MDITSYLLGKNASGGGGGNSNNVLVDTSLSYYGGSSGTGLASLIKSIDNIDFGNKTDFSYMFSYCINLEAIPLIDTSNTTSVYNMFRQCEHLLSIPKINTSNVENMRAMFSGCQRLQTVPILNTSKVTNFQQTFLNCYALTDDSVNNILQMCINATSYTGTKTLAYLGFNVTEMKSRYPIERIQALPNYQAFLDAGWTIGY